jgi:tetratricopeptide (TPR) repeat protein
MRDCLSRQRKSSRLRHGVAQCGIRARTSRFSLYQARSRCTAKRWRKECSDGPREEAEAALKKELGQKKSFDRDLGLEERERLRLLEVGDFFRTGARVSVSLSRYLEAVEEYGLEVTAKRFRVADDHRRLLNDRDYRFEAMFGAVRAAERYRSPMEADPLQSADTTNTRQEIEDLARTVTDYEAKSILATYLGRLDLQIGHPSDARGHFEDAYRSDPEYPYALLGLSCALHLIGESSAARASYTDALALSGTVPSDGDFEEYVEHSCLRLEPGRREIPPALR